MSVQITTAFVKQYHDNVYMLLQQAGSRLRDKCRIENQHSEENFYEQIGSVTAQEVATRHSDSPLISTPHDRRRVTLRFFEFGDLVDKEDKVQTLIDPTSPYAINAAWALGRSIDDVVISNMNGTAFTGKTGATSVTLPAGQIVSKDFATANSNLIVKKLIEAKRLFMAADVDFDVVPSGATIPEGSQTAGRGMGEKMYIVVGSSQLASLLNENQVQNFDFNTIKALVMGEVDTFLGFQFVRSERLAGTGLAAAPRQCMAWAKSGMLLAMGRDIQTEIARRADKRFSVYVYASMGIGATRMEEKKVVEVDCQEA